MAENVRPKGYYNEVRRMMHGDHRQQRADEEAEAERLRRRAKSRVQKQESRARLKAAASSMDTGQEDVAPMEAVEV